MRPRSKPFFPLGIVRFWRTCTELALPPVAIVVVAIVSDLTVFLVFVSPPFVRYTTREIWPSLYRDGHAIVLFLAL